MLNRSELSKKIKEKGYTNDGFANVLGINPATLYRKMACETDFTRSEIQLTRSALELSNEDTENIFFL